MEEGGRRGSEHSATISESKDTKSAMCGGLTRGLPAVAARTCRAAWSTARLNTRGLAKHLLSRASQRATRSSGMELSRTSRASWKVGLAFNQGVIRGGWPRGRGASLARSRGQEDWIKSSGRAEEEQLVRSTVCPGGGYKKIGGVNGEALWEGVREGKRGRGRMPTFLLQPLG